MTQTRDLRNDVGGSYPFVINRWRCRWRPGSMITPPLKCGLVSQASSRVWIGEVDHTAHSYVDDGVVCKFPNKSYCKAERMAWLSDDYLVIVSDRMSARKRRKPCEGKNQSIHVFRIPDQE